jgi:hypothetical protein
VVCSWNEGGCGSNGMWKPTEQEASDAWNRRV